MDALVAAIAADQNVLSDATFRKQLNKYVVTEADIESIESVVALCNCVSGPFVAYDPVRGYGLMADRDYSEGTTVTTYGGERIKSIVVGGPYMALAKNGMSTVDGRYGFKLAQKGRWVNEYIGGDENDKEKDKLLQAERVKHANVYLGMELIAMRDIAKYEWIYTDYGDEYSRSY
jgi:hypothetical protein